MRIYKKNKFISVKFSIIADEEWPLTAADSGCYWTREKRVENQVQCQAECELENGCVGIAYSPTHEDGQYCYLCSYPVTLKDASNGFGFYKMPGVEGTTQ